MHVSLLHAWLAYQQGREVEAKQHAWPTQIAVLKSGENVRQLLTKTLRVSRVDMMMMDLHRRGSSWIRHEKQHRTAAENEEVKSTAKTSVSPLDHKSPERSIMLDIQPASHQVPLMHELSNTFPFG